MILGDRLALYAQRRRQILTVDAQLLRIRHHRQLLVPIQRHRMTVVNDREAVGIPQIGELMHHLTAFCPADPPHRPHPAVATQNHLRVDS